MLELIDQYLAGLPIDRDLVSAKEVRDLLLDIRLTFMVKGDEPPAPEPETPPTQVFLYRWRPQIPPGLDGGDGER